MSRALAPGPQATVSGDHTYIVKDIDPVLSSQNLSRSTTLMTKSTTEPWPIGFQSLTLRTV